MDFKNCDLIITFDSKSIEWTAKKKSKPVVEVDVINAAHL